MQNFGSPADLDYIASQEAKKVSKEQLASQEMGFYIIGNLQWNIVNVECRMQNFGSPADLDYIASQEAKKVSKEQLASQEMGFYIIGNLQWNIVNVECRMQNFGSPADLDYIASRNNQQLAVRNEQWGERAQASERREPEPGARARREQGERRAASIADKNHSVNDFWRSDR